MRSIHHSRPWGFALVAVLVAPLATGAATLRVGPCGEFDTIQEAVDAATDGDSILVEPGSYQETVDWDDKGLSIIGIGGSAATTVRDTIPFASLFRVPASAMSPSLIQGFTLHPERGLGIRGDGSEAVFRDIVVAGWRPDREGLGNPGRSAGLSISADSSSVAVEDCRFIDNHCGEAVAASAHTYLGSVIIRNSWFERNQDHVRSVAGGGAISFYNTPADYLVESCVFLENGMAVEPMDEGKGGAISINGNSRVRGNWFEGNFAPAGGAIWVDAFHMGTGTRILGNVFVENRAIPSNGPYYDPDLRGGRGGAIYAWWPLASTTISNNLFFGNQSVAHADSEATDPFGSALISVGPAYISNNIFAANRGAPAVHLLNVGIEASYNLFHDNELGDHGGWLPDTTHDLHLDPLFFDEEQHDFRLRPDSPAIDAGDPDPPPGIRDPDGSRLDLGPYPFDQRATELLYVVPRRVAVVAGSTLSFHVLAGNLLDEPATIPLTFTFGPADEVEPVLLARRGSRRVPAQGSWEGELSFEVPADSDPGPHILRLAAGTAVEEIEIEVLWWARLGEAELGGE